MIIDYKEIPGWWAVCTNATCPMAEKCLRFMAFRSLPDHVTKWPCVLPSALKDGTCRYYQKSERVKMAMGFGDLYNKVRDRHARHTVRLQLTEYLGSKGTYYRYQHGERLLTPEQQQFIQQLAKTYGNGEEVDFGTMKETFDFQQLP